MNLRQLSQRARDWEQQILRNANREKIRVASVGLQVAVLTTPVDTGRARGAWVVSVNSPSSEVRRYRAPVGTAIINRGLRRIRRTQIDDEIFIQNNTEYIENLDQGSSRQAPSGITGGVLLAMRTVIQNSQLIEEV